MSDESTWGNNSSYVDSNTSQHLKSEDIHHMRQQGVSGRDIIRSLIQNSDTWESKSQFAREKWLARKQKRCAELLFSSGMPDVDVVR